MATAVPRWHDDRLWLLESGRGALVKVDPETGACSDVGRVPGFARGMDFIGPLAFIGLSQLRESNPFTDIPITDDNSDRLSGVWVIHVETGKTVAFLKFTGGIEEIFALQIMCGVQFPEILDEPEYLQNAYALSDAALKEVQRSPPAAGVSDRGGPSPG